MRFACLILGILHGVSSTVCAQPTTDPLFGLSEMIVPLDEPSPLLERAGILQGTVLAGIEPESSPASRSIVTDNEVFVLYGDLFKTGGLFALCELSPQRRDDSVYGVAFLEWTGGAWELRGLWKIPTVWRPKGWKASEDDYLHTTPATEPFQLRDLSGDGVPEVIVAGEVDKYFQEHYLLRFQSKTNSLSLLASAMAVPEVVGKYVRLYFDSGRRAIYSEWQFLEWSGDRLIPVAVWHEEVGYNPTDPTFSEGTRVDEKGNCEVVRVGDGEGAKIETEDYPITKNGKSFGRMRFAWKGTEYLPSINSGEIENAWLFEKITGLPRKFYPQRKDTMPVPRLEDLASVFVEGNGEAAKFFSNPTK